MTLYEWFCLRCQASIYFLYKQIRGFPECEQLALDGANRSTH